ncbi:MAG: glutathione S-transferase [Maricaulaceae bacterium]
MTALLYSFRRCPYAMRGRMALAMSGLPFEHREIILRDKPASMLGYSPKGTVPVFVTEQGEVIEESIDLVHYALGQNDPEGWLKGLDAASQQMIADNDGPFKHHLDRYKYASRYSEDAKRGDFDPSHRAAAEEYIAKLETRLSSSLFLAGETRGLADMTIFPFIRQFANTDRAWWDGPKVSTVDGDTVNTPPYPKTHKWLEGHLASDLFKSIMSKHPLWVDKVS